MRKKSKSTHANLAVSKTTLLPRLLLVGATGRNSGKTTLTCSIISNVSKHLPIIAIKITSIKDSHHGCPHGKNCGACNLLENNFIITEEKIVGNEKDTMRMLAAGASRVFWLRVKGTHITEGFETLLSKVPENAVLICESTTIRNAIEPGLFLITKRHDSNDLKPSAREVINLADRIVSFNGSTFDIDIDDIHFAKDGWALRENATAIVMAGGQSTRMGSDKSMLEIASKPMIARITNLLELNFKEILISANDPQKYKFLGHKVVLDREQNRGPLMGIASAIEASSFDLNFVQACDIPHLSMNLVRKMVRMAKDFDIVIPKTKEGFEPLFGIYRKTTLDAMNKVLEMGEGRISKIFDMCNVNYLDLGESSLLNNLNTKEEYLSYVHSLKGLS